MQKSFSDLEFAAKRKVTRRERFLSQIEAVTPWAALEEQLAPYYFKGQGPGRPPVGLIRMLRMYIAQQCFGLSDEGIEDAIYDSQAIRAFVGVDIGREPAPDATTLLKFRRLLERHGLTQVLFETINGHLAEHGLLLREGTVVDATLIAASPSTKNRERARDPEMHQTKKGNQYYFGMKAHIGADMHSGVVHSVAATAANVADVTQAHELLHGEEEVALGDAGYQGVEKRPEQQDSQVQWFVAMKRNKRKALGTDKLGRWQEQLEQAKARLRARVEHPFHVIKNLFGHRKTRYRGLAKNHAQLYALFALANLVRMREPLMRIRSQVASG